MAERLPEIPPEVAEPPRPVKVPSKPIAPRSRAFAPNPFAGDDGTRPEAFVRAKAVAPPERTPQVVRALIEGRVLMPVLPHAREGEIESHEACGQPTGTLVELPDGRHAFPVFTSAAAMAAWNPQARPVPTYGSAAAQSAAGSQDGLMLVDPGDEAVLIPRPAVWALATGNEWIPAWADREVAERAASALRGIEAAHAISLQPGVTTEVRAVLALRAGLAPQELRAAITSISEALAEDEVLRARIDSLELYPTSLKE